jgi:hypothetical protein
MHPDFAAGEIDTTWLDRRHEQLTSVDEAAPAAAIAAAAHAAGAAVAPRVGTVPAAGFDPWQVMTGWRPNAS